MFSSRASREAAHGMDSTSIIMFQIPKSLGLPLKTRYYTSIPDSFCNNNNNNNNDNNSNYLPRNPCIKLGRKPTAKSQQPQHR